MHLARIIHAAFFTRTAQGWGLPLYFIGEPGVAKSTFIRDFAKRVGVPCEVLSGAERGEGAFGVVPVPVKGSLTYPAPDWTAAFSKRGLVFLDEITSNPPIIQAPCMGLLLDKRIGSHQLPGGVRVWAACNPPEMAANGYEIAPPLANRGGWLRWHPPTIEEHIAYMLGMAADTTDNAVDCDAEEARVVKEWDGAYAKAVGLETGFLRAQADWKNKFPKSAVQQSAAWPSDRTWEMATRALASSFVHGLGEADRDEFVSSFIGQEAYAAFATFCAEQDLPNVAHVLDGKEEFKHDNRRLDRSAVVINSAVALVTPQHAEKREDRSNALWKLLAGVGDNAMDIIVPAATALVNAGLHGKGASTAMLARMNPVLAAAGVTARGGR